MTYCQFPYRSGENLSFVFLKAEKIYNALGMLSPSQGMTFSEFKKDEPQISGTFFESWNIPQLLGLMWPTILFVICIKRSL